MSRAGHEDLERRTRPDWCLFLDRDGVINRRVVDGYVTSWDRFEFLPGALEALSRLADWAPSIVVVTNQQGVGKGLMTQAAVDDVHRRMGCAVRTAGGRIDAVLTCPHLAATCCACRKPRTGLAESWLEGQPTVDRTRSVMVGDSASDLAMGRALTSGQGSNVWISNSDSSSMSPDLYDVRCSSLQELARSLSERLTDGEVTCASAPAHR